MAAAAKSMSLTKEDLLKHLALPSPTYTLMAKETERVYIWLTGDKSHLKKNCKRKAPFDWSDIEEKWKEDAMQALASRGDQYTAYYWALGGPPESNWVAKWFLYHKFRYRDGRNRPRPKEGDMRHASSSKHDRTSGRSDDAAVCYPNSPEDDGRGYFTPAASDPYYPDDQPDHQPDDPSSQCDDSNQGAYYDPIRDALR